MNMREADTAALERAPVVLTLPGCDPIEYVRIVQTGYTYDESGRHGFVKLLDKCGHSVTYADPDRCQLARKAVQTEKEKGCPTT